MTRDEQIELAERIRQYPVFFLREVLGCEPWDKQVEIVKAVRDNRYVAVKSCHGIGKDWLAARIALWFLYAYSPSMVITTGPTDRQVKGILWREIAQAYERSRIPLGGTLLTQSLTLSSDRWAIGFTSGDDANRFQGFHCRNAMVIIDEGCGVNPSTYTAVDAVLTSENVHRLEIGNPTDPVCEFAKSFKTPGIHKISVNAFETPNFTHFGITRDDITRGTWRDKVTGPMPIPELTTPEWVAERYERWGENNPLYRSRVLAEFPAAGDDTLIPLAWIEAAQRRELVPGVPNILGVDVARYGTDHDVIMHRRGNVLRRLMKFSQTDTMTTAGHVKRAMADTKAHYCNVDVVGIGAGVVDRLRELRISVNEASGGSAPKDPELYVNARAEWYWNLRRAFELGEIDIDPADEDLAAQLSDIRWKPDSKGRVTIESKEDMKKRMGHSPDDADAASMCWMSQPLQAPTFAKRRDRFVDDERPRF